MADPVLSKTLRRPQNILAGGVKASIRSLTDPPKVDHRLPSYVNQAPNWKLIRDCIEGQHAVKAAGTTYLTEIMPSDKTPANRDRNLAYLDRAVFVGFTRRTLKGLVGQVFSKPAELEIPTVIEALRDNIDGGAVSWDQQAKQCLSDVIAVGRCGLLVDFPKVEGPRTVAQEKEQKISATVQYYFAEQIINWRVEVIGGNRQLTMVNLEESYDVDDDGFEKTIEKQWRVLRLVDKVCQVEIWRKHNGVFTVHEITNPKGANGTTLDFLPFHFVGSDNNDPGIDDAPLLDMANLNIAHYRNSADFEEMVYLLGQPTLFFSGLTQKWVEEVWQEGVALGSRAAITGPQGSQATLLQVSESGLAKEAMEQKERQLVALGAKLVEQKAVQRTATEANQEEASEASTLQTAAQNVSNAYTRCVEWLGVFMGFAASDEMGYALNTDFEISRMTTDGRRQLLAEWNAGAIATSEYRDILRRVGIATLDDEEALAEIDAQTEKDMESQVALVGGLPPQKPAPTTKKPPPKKKA